MDMEGGGGGASGSALIPQMIPARVENLLFTLLTLIIQSVRIEDTHMMDVITSLICHLKRASFIEYSRNKYTLLFRKYSSSPVEQKKIITAQELKSHFT